MTIIKIVSYSIASISAIFTVLISITVVGDWMKRNILCINR